MTRMWVNKNCTIDKSLSFKEWINVIKQQGKMHVLYWKTKQIRKFIEDIRKNNNNNIILMNKTPEKALYGAYDTENAIIRALKMWEIEREVEYIKK